MEILDLGIVREIYIPQKFVHIAIRYIATGDGPPSAGSCIYLVILLLAIYSYSCILGFAIMMINKKNDSNDSHDTPASWLHS